MENLLRQLLLVFALAFMVNGTHGQSADIAFANSGFSGELAYLEKAALEPDVKKAVQHVQQLYASSSLNDSLASSLISLENLLINKLEEYFYLNYKPYNWEIILSLYENIAGTMRGLFPQGESLFYASAIYNLGMMIMNYGPLKPHHHDVLLLMKEALRIREKTLPPNHPDYAESLYGLAKAYHPENNEGALQLLQQAIGLLAGTKDGTKQIYANILLLLGNVYAGLHRYEEAARVLQEENTVRKELLGAGTASYALRLYVTGDFLLYTEKYGEAFYYFNESIRLTRKTLGEENLQYAFCLYGMGGVYFHLGAYKEALPFFQRSLAIKENLFGKNYSDVALSLHVLAKTYQRMGLYAQALPLFQRAAGIVEKANREGKELASNYGFSLKHLAAVYQEMRQYAPAYALLHKAASLTLPPTEAGGWFHAMCLQSLSLLFEDINRYDSALFYSKKALVLQKKRWSENHVEYASALHTLSGLYAKMNRADTALLLGKEAALIRRKNLGRDHPEHASSLARLGELYTNLGQFDSARQCLQEALKIREKSFGPGHPDYAKTLYSLGRLSLADGETGKAVAFISAADSLFFAYLWRTCDALSEQEKISLLSGEADQFSYLPSLAFDDNSSSPAVVRQLYATALRLKGMVLDNQQQVLNSIRQSRDSTALALYFAWRANRSILAREYLKPIPERRASFDSLQEQTNNLEEQLAYRSSVFHQQKTVRTFTAKDVGNRLQTGEAAVEFIRFRYCHRNWTDSVLYAAIVLLPGDSAGAFVPLFEEKQLAQLLRSSAPVEPWAIQKLYPGEKSRFSGSSRSSLYQLIWEPLEKQLLRVHTVYFAPAGLLHRVAFDALRTKENRLLIDRFKLYQVFSTRSLASFRPFNPLPSSVTLWEGVASQTQAEQNMNEANAVRKGRGENSLLKPLPGVKQEITRIADLCAKTGIRATIVSGERATEEEFKKLDGKSPEVLHLATHGFFQGEKENQPQNNKAIAPHPFLANAMLNSSLLMARKKSIRKANGLQPEEDGILTAYEIAQMDLSKTRLVVLSACNTALGDLRDEEGVLGLQRALKLAGVGQMMISLWKVPDKETTELMHLFYRAWLNGMDTDEKNIPAFLLGGICVGGIIR
jgi:CHAT domain-containing protein/tetratricopeptide (TPR) repeat protein